MQGDKVGVIRVSASGRLRAECGGSAEMGDVGGGELQFERDADGLRRSSRRPADLSAGPPARGPRRGGAPQVAAP